MDTDDLIVAFAVLFFAVMIWAYGMEHRIEMPYLDSLNGCYIDWNGEDQ
jgi:hypothetical protein